MKTPMSSNTKITKDEKYESVDSTKYRGMIGSLLYLTASRPDIMFSVCLCVHFQEAPKTSHLEAVKRIFRYIKGTTHLGLWYPKGTGIETVVYADSDHAGDYVDQRALAVTMPRATGLDHQKTRNYIPLISNEFNQPLLNTMANLEKRYFHEGRVVSPNFKNMSHIRAKFESIGFDCLLDINEQIVPRFVLEFYCQLTFTYNPEGQFVVNFVIQNKSFSLTLEEFGQILKIPFKGQASNTEMWSLDHLSVSVPSRGLYKTKPPSPRAIKTLIQVPRQGQETRTKNKKTIVVGENEILTREIQTHMKPWVDIIRENRLCLGGLEIMVSSSLSFPYGFIAIETPPP
ncbi:hypothetical protein Tco_0750781 [Tanacetum coccineum]|uniref:Mitochondrial protein n=1 Tax=Tanacetum coccineum TaxID=301880 RepID=A0ABQ4Z2G0_9ASTR